MSLSEDTTALLHAWRGGESEARDALISLLHSELRVVARRAMRSERADHTLQPTALVNEVFLRLVEAEVSWQDRAHFFAVAAQSMRRILVDHARSRGRAKRGRDYLRVPLLDSDSSEALAKSPNLDLLALQSALQDLERRAPQASRAIELSYFAGLSYPELAEVMGVSRATAARELRFAKAWLRRKLELPEPAKEGDGL